MTTANELTLDLLQNENELVFSTNSDIVMPKSDRKVKIRKSPSLFNVITGPRGV